MFYLLNGGLFKKSPRNPGNIDFHAQEDIVLLFIAIVVLLSILHMRMNRSKSGWAHFKNFFVLLISLFILWLGNAYGGIVALFVIVPSLFATIAWFIISVRKD